MQESILPAEFDSFEDAIESSLRSISQNIIIFVFGLLPLLFIPVVFVPTAYMKIVFVIVGVLLAIIFFSLTVLRSGKIQIAAPLALFALWLCALATLLSALLSGDTRDAFFGDDFGVHTALFVILLALVATITPLLGQTKTTIMRLYILLTGSALALGAFHMVRLLGGSDLLSFGVFTDIVSTPVGGWNDLALFFGLSILLSLVALEQLPLTKWGKGLFGAVVAIALLMLAIVNFFAVWVVLGLVSLIVLMYSLTKDRFAEKTLTLEGKKSTVSLESVILSTCVFIVSLVFVIGGGAVGGSITKLTDISYVEVRPSFEATTDIARHVYRENALFGIGPNKFVDAWRMYKDQSINQTVFWSTDFLGGSGYITTLFVTTGALGALAWILFFILFLFSGFKMLFNATHVDRFWYFIGTSSFVASIYLWGMSFLYVPGATILLLAGLFTGITFTAYGALINTRSFSISISSNKRAGFVLVGMVMVVIVGATSMLYFVGQNYGAVYAFGEGSNNLQQGIQMDSSETQIAEAYAISNNEAYALQLALYNLAKVNALAGVAELTAEQQNLLQTSVRNGITSAQLAVEKDSTDSLAWSTYGSILTVLAGAQVEGSNDRARQAFETARKYDPTNPLYPLLQAQLYARVNDLVSARSSAQEAITLKPNYTEALQFLVQIDIAEGKTADAVKTTQAVISIEPNNPARYYQLGILESALQNLDAGISAFTRAVELDTNYANARYRLALALAQKGDIAGSIVQLQKVAELNPGNAEIASLIASLESGVPLEQILAPNAVVEPETVGAVDDAVTTTEEPDTALITPVNTVADTEEPEVSSETAE